MDIYVAHLLNPRQTDDWIALILYSKCINSALQCINKFYQHGHCLEIHKSQGSCGCGSKRYKDAVIYYNIDTQNRADLSPVCVSGRGRDIKNSSEEGRGCHMEYVASCSDDHRQ